MAVVRQVRLRFALPWFRDLFADPPADDRNQLRADAAEWLIARASTNVASAGDWRRWLLVAAGVPAGLLEQFPAGPCARWKSTTPQPGATWACARPVHLLTAIDHLQFGPADIELDEDECRALVATLNAHFADRGFTFRADGDGPDWTLQSSIPCECSSIEPAQVSGQNLRDLMPHGRDSARVRSLMNEIQMLLHEHPVNGVRAARGLPTVNALWLWGFGKAGATTLSTLPTLYADDAWLVGLWRLHGHETHALRDFQARSGPEGTDVLLAWSRRPRGSDEEAIAEADHYGFSPAREAMSTGRFTAIDVLLGDRAFSVGPSARWRFWRRCRPLQSVFT